MHSSNKLLLVSEVVTDAYILLHQLMANNTAHTQEYVSMLAIQKSHKSTGKKSHYSKYELQRVWLLLHYN